MGVGEEEEVVGDGKSASQVGQAFLPVSSKDKQALSHQPTKRSVNQPAGSPAVQPQGASPTFLTCETPHQLGDLVLNAFQFKESELNFDQVLQARNTSKGAL